MGREKDDTETLTLDDLARRMSAYRERALAARRLADSISDERATFGLRAHAEAFTKKAEALAAEIVLRAHLHTDAPAAAPSNNLSTHRKRP